MMSGKTIYIYLISDTITKNYNAKIHRIKNNYAFRDNSFAAK